MGLRAASVRRQPGAEVMAPALTDNNQAANLKLANGFKALTNVFENLNTLALASQLLKAGDDKADKAKVEEEDDAAVTGFMMNDDKMGLHKPGLVEDVSALLKDGHKGDNAAEAAAAAADVDQLFNSFNPADLRTDLPQNVEDVMQLIKSMEATNADRLGAMSSDQDSIFPLASLEKELFNAVDIMAIDEQLTHNKETQTKDLIAEAEKKQAKLERQLDFLLRRVRKFQARTMGQHVSGEVAGVYEHVHRTLKRSKDTVKTDEFDTAAPLEQPQKLKPISYNSTKNLVKKLEMTAVVQGNNALRQKHNARYFGSGSFEPRPGYYGSGVGGVVTLPQWSATDKQELQQVAGNLESEFSLVQDELDSEATVSSSGGESCDEMQTYNNPHQQYLPIQKRAAWRYAMDRAAIACRWTWLQSQVSDLEYRIRQHNDLYRRIRASKERVKLGGASPTHTSTVPSSPGCVNGYRGQLPGAPISSKNAPETTAPTSIASSATGAPPEGPTGCPDVQCARTRPLMHFRKRKLLQFTGLHAVSKKAARPSTVRCGCIVPEVTCALCTGRTDPTHPRDVPENLSGNDRLGLLDPAFHPVFSFPEDASAMLHMEAIMKTHDWQQRSSRSNIKSIKFLKNERIDKGIIPTSVSGDNRLKKIDHRKKYNRLLKSSTVNALSAKIKNRHKNRKGSNVRHHTSLSGTLKKRPKMLLGTASDGADEEVESLGISGSSKFDSPSTSPLLAAQAVSGFQRKNRVDSYDIDNIIIPYSVAASTRVEKLQYKEILTPKWRISEVDHSPAKYDQKNNGTVRTSQEAEDTEDISDDALTLRHDKCEQEERKKFLSYLKLPIGYGRSRANRRTDSRAESSGANTPDPMSPAPPPPLLDSTENTVSPLTSPPATPLPPFCVTNDESPFGGMMSISALRKRTLSQSRPLPYESRCITPDIVEELPYEKRVFPLSEEIYENMVIGLPDGHKLKTNIRSQDSSVNSDYDDKVEDYHDSESTESAYGDEDPNDPEWEVEEDNNKDKYRR